jgi:hypothetical protein
MFPRALREQGLKVATLFEIFHQYDTKDRDWLPKIPKEWVVLTADYRMRYRERERDAIMENGLRMFILRGHLHTQRIASFLGNLHHVERFLRTYDEGFLAKVYQDRIEMWLTHADWRRNVGLGEPGKDDEP